MSNIHPKSLSSNWLESVVNDWRLQETKVEGLNMRKVGGQLDFQAYVSAEGYIFNQNRHARTDKSLADTDC